MSVILIALLIYLTLGVITLIAFIAVDSRALSGGLLVLVTIPLVILLFPYFLYEGLRDR